MLHLLSADVISRYLRLLGEEVISVTGSDAHGTPIIIAAQEQEISPDEFVRNKHEQFLSILEQWDIRFDHYTVTTTDQHRDFVQEFYSDLLREGQIEERQTTQYYCSTCQRFLPDRFVIGTCPSCGENQARGDQCSFDDCNIPLTPFDLQDPVCQQCHQIPEKRDTTHWYFKLSDFEPQIKEFLQSDTSIPDTFRKEALAFVNRGLDNRALTRDLSWGIPASTIFGSDKQKVFYVWAEDVLGYISASIPVIEERGGNWEEVWNRAKTIYCLGKDNLFYHGIWLPALQLASSQPYTLPDVLSITHFIQFNGQGFSKSKGVGIWADDALDLVPADYWRFYLIYSRPENRDANFTWEEFARTINKYLANTIGNLIVRSVTLFHTLPDAILPDVNIEDSDNIVFLEQIAAIEKQLCESVYTFSLKNTLEQTLEVASLINQHLEVTRPWIIDDIDHKTEILVAIYWSLLRLSLWLEPVVPGIVRDIRDQLAINNIRFYQELEDLQFPIKIPDRQFFIEKVDANETKNKI